MFSGGTERVHWERMVNILAVMSIFFSSRDICIVKFER